MREKREMREIREKRKLGDRESKERKERRVILKWKVMKWSFFASKFHHMTHRTILQALKSSIRKKTKKENKRNDDNPK